MAAGTPTAIIESQLRPSGEPVIGLYLHIAYHVVRASFGGTVGQGGITPAMIGVITLVAEHPRISQAELARVIGLERATVGTTVARTIQAGFVRRTDAHDDGRRYALSLTPRGQRALRTLRRRIDAHEALIAGHLTAGERRRLRQLLHKLVYGVNACARL
jgi:DNA-binding MarR family transcriptional regulator